MLPLRKFRRESRAIKCTLIRVAERARRREMEQARQGKAGLARRRELIHQRATKSGSNVYKLEWRSCWLLVRLSTYNTAGLLGCARCCLRPPLFRTGRSLSGYSFIFRSLAEVPMAADQAAEPPGSDLGSELRPSPADWQQLVTSTRSRLRLR